MDIHLPHLLKRLFFPPLNCLDTLVESQLVINIVGVYFWTLSSSWSALICMSVLKRVPHCLAYCSFAVSFEIRKCESSSFVLHFQDCFDYFRSPAFSHKFQDQLFIFCRKVSCDFHRGCIESVDHVREYCHLNGIIFPWTRDVFSLIQGNPSHVNPSILEMRDWRVCPWLFWRIEAIGEHSVNICRMNEWTNGLP